MSPLPSPCKHCSLREPFHKYTAWMKENNGETITNLLLLTKYITAVSPMNTVNKKCTWKAKEENIVQAMDGREPTGEAKHAESHS